VNAADAPTVVVPVIPPHPSSPQGGWLAGFPQRSFLELGAYRNAAGSARGHARNVLAEWGLADFTDAVTLVVSELITNSVTAAEKAKWDAGVPPVRLWMLAGPGADGGGEVLVAVWDAVAGQPARREAGAEDVSGRGLAIVDWLSGRQWDYYLPGAPHGGKVTRALIDRRWRDQPPGLGRPGRDRRAPVPLLTSRPRRSRSSSFHRRQRQKEGMA
jgi:anti-sigma regulatory factor (Ser/Thr protein kinase)